MTGPHGPVFSLYFMTRKDCIMDQTDRYAIELRGIDKRFGDVYANKQIDLQVRKGSIHGIVGELDGARADERTIGLMMANIVPDDVATSQSQGATS